MEARRILLVEGSAAWRCRIAALLLDEGYHLATATDGEEGLTKCREQSPDLVLSEYELPGLDGSTLCRTIKQDKELQSIPVLLFRAAGELQTKPTELDNGADDHIPRPNGPDETKEMLARIDCHLRISSLRRKLSAAFASLEAAQRRLVTALEAGAVPEEALARLEVASDELGSELGRPS